MDYNELISCFQDTIKMSEDELQDATLEAIDNTCVLKENIYEEVFENSNVKIKERPEDADVFVEVNTTFATAKEYLQDGKVAVLKFCKSDTSRWRSTKRCNGSRGMFVPEQ